MQPFLLAPTRSCFLSLTSRMLTSYLIVRKSELVFIFPYLKTLESQKTMTSPACFLAHTRSEELFVKSNIHLYIAIYFATSMTLHLMFLLAQVPPLAFLYGKIQLQVRFICALSVSFILVFDGVIHTVP